MWSVYHGNIVIEWGKNGVFLAQPQQDKNVDINITSPTSIVGSAVENPNNRFTAKFLQKSEAADGDYYTVLGITDTAEKADIKRAYRRLSVKYHPDKDPSAEAKEMFDSVRNAYEVLSDNSKRQVYDTGGISAVERYDKGQVQRTADSKGEIQITLAQVYNGAKFTVNAKRRVVCRGCANRRSPECQVCGDCPAEIRVVKRRVGPFTVNQKEQVSSNERCKEEATPLEVLIEKGIKNGHELRFEGKGEQRPGEIPGNMILKLKVANHPVFTRVGSENLEMELHISLREALIGFDRSVVHLDGHKVPL
jgi:DnaJ-class molecular chaperone